METTGVELATLLTEAEKVGQRREEIIDRVNELVEGLP